MFATAGFFSSGSAFMLVSVFILFVGGPRDPTASVRRSLPRRLVRVRWFRLCCCIRHDRNQFQSGHYCHQSRHLFYAHDGMTRAHEGDDGLEMSGLHFQGDLTRLLRVKMWCKEGSWQKILSATNVLVSSPLSSCTSQLVYGPLMKHAFLKSHFANSIWFPNSSFHNRRSKSLKLADYHEVASQSIKNIEIKLIVLVDCLTLPA